MAAAQKKAVDLMAKGEKCLTKFSFFGGGSQKYEDAAECFNDAGKQFVMGKAYGEGRLCLDTTVALVAPSGSMSAAFF